jgi:hypothetical protein
VQSFIHRQVSCGDVGPMTPKARSSSNSVTWGTSGFLFLRCRKPRGRKADDSMRDQNGVTPLHFGFLYSTQKTQKPVEDGQRVRRPAWDE